MVSLDPTTGDLAMVSFPRDLSRLPTPDGKMYTGKINSLMSYADKHKDYPNWEADRAYFAMASYKAAASTAARPIARRSVGSRAGLGVSSTIFWCRL